MGDPAPHASSGPTLCCDRCGCPPGDPLQQILMNAVWLVDGPDRPITACYCRACAPGGPITDLTCQRCGDGPLLAGDLAADPDGQLPARAQGWLTAAGWNLTGPVCPTCHPSPR
ncbi:putative resolvase [Pseudonocardia sp. Ae406_Ps2]|nr:putative resolvase [Pseudonocardia sp. Ae331_Ps2]OLL96123.1 putative resolvase [Pseudonocardia sp. Ae406_Ps2]OLM08556.1 putative resolvase [Pseudonocardia sp. Ae505_Ps2]